MNNARAIIAGICAFGILAAGIGWHVSRRQPHVAPVVPDTVEYRRAPAGWREYTHTAYRFSLFYPPEFNVTEYPEEGNAVTLTLQDTDKKEGFQIFVVPYDGAQISEEQFKRDVPSGIRVDASDVMVDGAVGAAFYSTDTLLGDTREIWFVRNGFLFEITAPKAFAARLDDIMQTWTFLP